jgi:hypothetical protein
MIEEWLLIPLSSKNDNTHQWISSPNHSYVCQKCGLIKSADSTAKWNVSCNWKQNNSYSIYEVDIDKENYNTHNWEVIRQSMSGIIIQKCVVCGVKVCRIENEILVIGPEYNLSCDEYLIMEILE